MSYNLARRIQTLEKIFELSSDNYRKPEFEMMNDFQIGNYIRGIIGKFNSRDEVIRQFKLLLIDSKPLPKEVEQTLLNVLANPDMLDVFFELDIP